MRTSSRVGTDGHRRGNSGAVRGSEKSMGGRTSLLAPCCGREGLLGEAGVTAGPLLAGKGSLLPDLCAGIAREACQVNDLARCWSFSSGPHAPPCRTSEHVSLKDHKGEDNGPVFQGR